ncbi:hypothetical protein V7247_26315, partial [Priestia megaterium]|uniref:hypothetical protein n=1 Tax=Priestia megaterium TaxID=1404 RepID=UPI002FFDB271
LVYINTLQGSKKAKEPLQEKGSLLGAFNRICSLLYTFDMTVISLGVCEEKAYRKTTFYTYAHSSINSHYGKNMLLFTCGYILVLYN